MAYFTQTILTHKDSLFAFVFSFKLSQFQCPRKLAVKSFWRYSLKKKITQSGWDGISLRANYLNEWGKINVNECLLRWSVLSKREVWIKEKSFISFHFTHLFSTFWFLLFSSVLSLFISKRKIRKWEIRRKIWVACGRNRDRESSWTFEEIKIIIIYAQSFFSC